MPLLSIITINKDDRAGLARTLEDVARQTFRDRELIVVDGGSSDGSVELARAHAAVTDLVSEPDEGIYDAQNKGIRRARGTFCLFLNAGDGLASDEALARLLGGEPDADIVYGDVVLEEAGERRLLRTPDPVTLQFLMRTTLPHQAIAFRRELFQRLGEYDTSYRIVADYEFLLRAVVVHGATTRKVPVPVAIQVIGGVSSRPESFPRWRAERARARERVLSPVLRAFWDDYVAARRGRVLHFLHERLRPLARRLRAWSRAARGRPDSSV